MLANAIIPGATVVALARRLGLAAPAARAPQADVELVARREYAGSFVWYHVAAASAVAGALVRELPLPAECVLTIVLRGAEVVAPRGDVRLLEGDAVCVFVTAEHRPLLDLRFAQRRRSPDRRSEFLSLRVDTPVEGAPVPPWSGSDV